MFDAVVTAAGRISDEFAARARTHIKALVPVQGKPMLDYVMDAIWETGMVERIAVVGPKEVLDSPSAASAQQRLLDVGSAPENIAEGLKALNTDRLVLVSASDMPHLTAEAVRDFLTNAPQDADVVYAFARDDTFTRAYPGCKHLTVPLKDGKFTGGGLQLVKPASFPKLLALANRVFAVRKSPLGMAGLLGPWSTFRFILTLLGLPVLSIANIERRAAALSRLNCRGYVSTYPGVAFDVDKLEHLQYAEHPPA